MTAIFDVHCHIIDPHFPLIANNGFLPEPFGVDAYLSLVKPLGIVGGAVVSGSFQGFDQSYLLDALARLGPGFVGVTQLPECWRRSSAALQPQARRVEQLDQLEALAMRVHERLGWHSELYIDSRELGEIETRLHTLPAISIDHLGLSAEGLPALLRLAERGAKGQKPAGFGRVDFPVREALEDIHAANPNALMFGTDLPSTRGPRPFQADDID